MSKKEHPEHGLPGFRELRPRDDVSRREPMQANLHIADVSAKKRAKTEVLQTNGKPIDWTKPPKKNDMVLWSKKDTGGDPVRGGLRTIAHIDRLNYLAMRRFERELEVIQPCYNTGVAASAGTHDFDAVLDVFIPDVSWWDQQRFFRANGFGCWYRHPPTFGNHIHGFTLPEPEGRVRGDDFAMQGTKVGKYVPGQLTDYYNHAFGLSGQHDRNSDQSWFPHDIDATVFRLNVYVNNRRKRQLAERKES